jgi:hypothetical protein
MLATVGAKCLHTNKGKLITDTTNPGTVFNTCCTVGLADLLGLEWYLCYHVKSSGGGKYYARLLLPNSPPSLIEGKRK